ncbi:MAG TPA: VanW family protein [Actinomycetes bacterium]|nr:VanW family protein [Actinomycetes bacterium]
MIIDDNTDDVLPADPDGADRRAAWFAAGGLLALLLLLWAAAWVAVGSGVPRGTTVLGVAIGGLDHDRAAATLSAELGPRSTAPIAVTVPGAGPTDAPTKSQVDPAAAGLRLDVEATLEAAGGRSLNPVALVSALFGGHELDPVVTVDEPALKGAVAKLATTLGQPVVDGDVTFEEARAVPVQPASGREIDEAATEDRLRAAYLHESGPIELPSTVVAPKVAPDEVTRAFEEFGRPAVSGPITISSGNATVSLAPERFAPALSMAPDEQGRLVPHVDGAVLAKDAADELAGLERPARDAAVQIVSGKPQVIEGQTGLTIDPDVLGEGVLPALTSSERVATVSLTEVEPELTTAAVNALGIVEQVSSFTTRFPHASYRNTNIGRAAALIDGTLLRPGETFSLNGIVGERTRANGFTEGFIIRNGRFETDLGGGVSQVATTTFNAAFFAGLKDVEHHPHSLYISRYPEGREATVAWGSKDLRFTNDSPYGVLIDTAFSRSAPGRQGVITVSIYSTKVYDVTAHKSARYRARSFPTVYDTSATCHAEGGVSGFDVDVTRVFHKDGKQVRRETMHTRYQPTPRVVCGPKPAPTPSPGTTVPAAGSMPAPSTSPAA